MFFCSALFLASCETSKVDSNCIDYITTKNTQDMPLPNIYKNPLRGLSSFTFFAVSPVAYDTIKAQLQKHALVNKIKIFEETESGLHYNEVSLDPIITFDVKEICSLDGKNLPFIRASLNVESHIIVEKTKEKCDSYIWTKNCFIPEKAYQKNKQEMVTQSLEFLLELFIKDYTAANSTKPIFDLVDPGEADK